MDKLTLNNQIVSMRQEVKKAKLYTINKLIRESRRLKSRNGPEERKKKYNRKAERFMEEVLTIKKLKDDDISKFALCSAQMPHEIIADPAALLKEKVLARVSSQPNILAWVTQFRMKYPAGVHILPQLFMKLGGKARKKKKQKVKTCQNEQDKATLSSKNEICTHESICNKDHTIMSLNHDETIVIHNQGRQQKTPVTVGKTQNELNEKKSKENVCLKCDPVTAVKRPKELSEKKSKESVGSKSETKMTENSLAEVKRFTELLNAENNIENDNLDVVSLTSADSTCATTVDPFFVCEDGETEYLTNVKVDASSSEEGDIRKRKRLSKSIRNKNDEKRFFQVERRKSIKEQKLKNSNFKAFQQQPTNISSNSKQKISVASHEKKQSPLTDNNGPIHPSWEAKKKLREQQCAVFAFQGKKIKFDD